MDLANLIRLTYPNEVNDVIIASKRSSREAIIATTRLVQCLDDDVYFRRYTPDQMQAAFYEVISEDKALADVY